MNHPAVFSLSQRSQVNEGSMNVACALRGRQQSSLRIIDIEGAGLSRVPIDDRKWLADTANKEIAINLFAHGDN